MKQINSSKYYCKEYETRNQEKRILEENEKTTEEKKKEKRQRYKKNSENKKKRRNTLRKEVKHLREKQQQQPWATICIVNSKHEIRNYQTGLWYGVHFIQFNFNSTGKRENNCCWC